MKPLAKAHYLLAGCCVVLFILAQTFQEVAYDIWIPESRSPQQDLSIFLMPVDRARALLILATIVVLIVPFIVIAIRCFELAPVASIVGLIFGSAFIGFEMVHRSADFFVIGSNWASHFAHAASDAERDTVLHRFALWNEMIKGWFFPQLLSFLICSVSFAIATWKDSRARGAWRCLAPLAFALAVLRLLARLLSSYAGPRWHWLDGFNGPLYFPARLDYQLAPRSLVLPSRP